MGVLKWAPLLLLVACNEYYFELEDGMQKHIVDIPFTGGLEQKIAAKILPPDGRLVEMKNTRVSKLGEIAKDYGEDSAGRPVAEEIQLFANKGQLLALGETEVFRYLGDTSWESLTTKFLKGEIDTEPVMQPPIPDAQFTGDSEAMDIAYQDGFFVVVAGAYMSVIEAATGVRMQNRKLFDKSMATPAVVVPSAIGNRVFIVWINSANDVLTQILDMDSPTSVGVQATIAADGKLTTNAGLDALALVQQTGNAEIIVAYHQTGTDDVVIHAVSSAGVSVDSSTIARTMDGNVSLTLDGTTTGDDAFFVCWRDTFGAFGSSLYGRAYSWDGTSLSAESTATQIILGAIGADPAIGGAGIAVPTAASIDFYQNMLGATFGVGGAFYYIVVKTLSYTAPGSALTVVARNSLSNVEMSSRPYSINSRIYFWVNHQDRVWGEGADIAAGQFLMYDDGTNYHSVGAANYNRVPTGVKHLPHIVDQSTAEAGMQTVLPRTGTPWYDTSADEYRISPMLVSFTLARRQDSVEMGGSTLLTGPQFWMYDGKNFVEKGFHYAPTISNGAAAGIIYHLSAGSYSYRVVYEWTDASGRIHRSTPSPIETVAGVNATERITATVKTLGLTAKDDVVIRVYRTIADGTEYFAAEHVMNDKTVNSLTIYLGNDARFTDTELSNNAQIYTAGGVYDSAPIPPPTHLAIYGNRVWATTPENKLYYSKILRDDVAPEFNDAAYLIIEQGPGRLVAAQACGQRMLAFTTVGIMQTYGEGPNDQGIGSFAEPKGLKHAVGVPLNTKPVSWPGGCMFESNKGIWNIGLDLSATHIGAQVEDLETPIAAGLHGWPATGVLPTETEVWFGNDFRILRYNYELGQWMTNETGRNSFAITTAAGVQSNQFGVFTADVNGNVFKRDATEWTTNNAEILTGWIRPSNIVGFSRLYWLTLLGTYKSPHAMTITLEYEDGTTEAFLKNWDASDEPYEVRMKPARQKAPAFRVRVKQTWRSGTYEAAQWHGLTLYMGTKRKTPMKPTKTL